jgi:2-polyprenyl-3-methyl-5-hydroxy-6-metoxy-1,4-benzoquinol methylase
MSYNNKQYWNSLVGNQMSLQEVGWPQWTEAFNRVRYKLCAEQTVKILEKHCPTKPLKILEIGCGIGFWTNLLTQLYPDAEYTGIDISSAAIEKLKSKYASNNKVSFACEDISSTFGQYENKQYDLIICMEVLLHIVLDASWQKALQNIFESCNTNGVVLISDPFTIWNNSPKSNTDNNKIRTWQTYQNAIETNQGTIISVTPRTFLLDNNMDFKTKMGGALWRIFFKGWHQLLCIKNEKFGAALGSLAYRFDKWYCKPPRLGNSCRLIVVKKG